MNSVNANSNEIQPFSFHYYYLNNNKRSKPEGKYIVILLLLLEVGLFLEVNRKMVHFSSIFENHETKFVDGALMTKSS
jgi:hypothetical protein